QEVRAYKRATLYTLIPILIGLIVFVFSAWGALRLERSKRAALEQAAIANSEVVGLKIVKKELEAQNKHIRVALLPKDVDDQEIINRVQGKRRQALENAFNLYRRQPPISYEMGGKTPQEGFDTSAFVAYVLGKVGLLDRPETYW